jgi:hypothetical protein
MEHDFSELTAELDRLLGVAQKADPLHVEWPKHPDGSNRTIGEMTRDEARAQTGAACRRLAEEGFRCYQRGGSSSEYWAVGAAAQAFDRGFEAAMRVRRLQRGA